MGEYIDRNLLGEYVRSGYIDVEPYVSEHINFIDYDVVMNMEPEDVQPVTHAHWIVTELSTKWRFLCSNCRVTYEDDECSNLGWKYCPDCGAKMDMEDYHYEESAL